ncbi:hypothetical protein [Streptomyces sp. 8L]|nr:hypothetical protein [Streptomyces sp. 8L]
MKRRSRRTADLPPKLKWAVFGLQAALLIARALREVRSWLL